MTDNEIILTMRYFSSQKVVVNHLTGQVLIMQDILDLINRQKAEIERLKKDALPYKLGDVFYHPLIHRNEVDECKVSMLRQRADGSWKMRLTSGIYKSVFEITLDRIGEIVFLTKEEAEEALEKQKK